MPTVLHLLSVPRVVVKKRQKGKQAAAEAVTDSKVKMYSSRRERDDLFEARTWIIEYNARAAAAAASIR